MNRYQRRHSFRKPKKFFIIATEGECTEELYFKAFRPSRDAAIQLKVLPTRKGQSDPKSVLARLKSYLREAGSGATDEMWLVVDRDHWTEKDLDEVAESVVKMPGYFLAVSNPCFELWLVLHRRKTSGQNCSHLQEILKRELGGYAKSDYDVEALKLTVAKAIERAEQMDTPAQSPWPRKEGTHVYRLVRKLMER